MLPRRAAVPSFAKVNLSLKVLGRRPDGYHELRTVFQTVGLADRIEFEFAPARRGLQIELDDPLGIEDNLVLRAARLFCESERVRGRLRMRLLKRIPMGAGLGGGSGNAASVLLALGPLTGRNTSPQRLHALAASLGSEDAGGQNVYVDDLSRHLSRLGYAVDIFTRRTSPDQPVILDWAPGVRIVHLDAGPPCPVAKDQLWCWMPELRDAFLRFLAERHAWYDLIHAHFWMSGWVALELKRRLGIPVAQTFHALGQTKRRHQGDADTSPPARLAIERAIVHRADQLIAQCPSERQELVLDYGAVPMRLAMIPAGVDTTLFRPVDRIMARLKLGLDPAEPVVVYVGRI